MSAPLLNDRPLLAPAPAPERGVAPSPTPRRRFALAARAAAAFHRRRRAVVRDRPHRDQPCRRPAHHRRRAPRSTARRSRRSRRARGREPNHEELTALRRVWLDNEVLYRYGLDLQVDKGDTAIRERVIFKALSVIDSNVKLPQADGRRCFASGSRPIATSTTSRGASISTRPRWSGESSEAAVRDFVEAAEQRHAWRRQGGPPRVQGPASVEHRPELRARAGEGAGGMRSRASGRRCRTHDGWRAIRLNAVHAGEAGGVRGPARRGVARLDRRHRRRAAHRRGARSGQEVQDQARAARRGQRRMTGRSPMRRAWLAARSGGRARCCCRLRRARTR